jgi:transcriptional regulator
MYNLPYFKEKDEKLILEFIQKHPFAFMAGVSKELKPVATQIPVFIENRDGRLFLSGHMMKNQDHHIAFEKNNNVLCVFSGNHTYISATWYDNPHQASTWNYMSVHVKGKIQFLGDESLVDVLRKTSLHFENNNPHSTTVFDNLPDDYKLPLLKAIVAFEVEVESIDNVFKLSQNHKEDGYDNIIEHLNNGPHDAKMIAEEMKKRKP